MAHWLILETGSNQSYIFGTSKQRLQVAASAAIWDLGYHWVREAIDDAIANSAANGTPKIEVVDEVNENWTSDEWQRRIQTSVVHVVEASGKAYVLVPDRDFGVDVIRRVTGRAISTGSGIDVWGYVAPEPLADDLADAADALRAATIELDRLRSRRLSPIVQEQLLPFHQPCAYTGLPAVSWKQETSKDKTESARSPKAEFLFGKGLDARKRLITNFINGSDSTGDQLSAAIKEAVISERDRGEVFEDSSWIGVIHADGNGIGKIFTNLAKISEDGVDFIRRQMLLSRNLEKITWEALRLTVAEVWYAREHDDKPPTDSVLPILVGGDDVIVVVDGPIAADFAVALSRNFLTVAQGELGVLFAAAFQAIRDSKKPLDANEKPLDASEKPFGAIEIANLAAEDPQEAQQLSMAVGLAVVKPKHPFHHAVALAEKLTERAKEATRAEGSVAVYRHNETALRPLDHALLDASIEELCYLARPLRVAGTGVGTVDELVQMITELNATYQGTGQKFREALTTKPTVAATRTAFSAARKQAQHLHENLGPMLGAIAVLGPDSTPDKSLFAEDSPSSLITAIELCDLAEHPFAGARVKETA